MLGNTTYRKANVLDVRDFLNSSPYFKICLTLQICLGISAILSNSIVLGFYIRQKAGIVSTMYRFLSGCDLITGLSSFLYIPALYLMQGNPADLEMIYFALRIVSIITIITAKVSIFFNVVLAVIRTINIRTPFYSINARLVLICAIVYPVFWVLIVGVLFFKEPGEVTELNKHDLATLFLTQLHPGLNTKVKLDFILLVMLYLGLPLILPTGILISCFLIQSYSLLAPVTHTMVRASVTTQTLLKTPELAETHVSLSPEPATILKIKPRRRITFKHRQITITILLITLLAASCNTPYSVYLMLHYASNGEILNLGLIYLFCTTLLYANSALNPLLLIFRGSAIRKYVTKSTTKVWMSSKRSVSGIRPQCKSVDQVPGFRDNNSKGHLLVRQLSS